MALHELLGKALAGLKLRRRLRGAEDSQATSMKFIDDTKGQRQFRTDDSDIRLMLVGNRVQAIKVSWISGQAGGLLADAAIAGDAQHLRDTRRLAQLPHQRMLTSTVADYQDFHFPRRHLRINQMVIRCEWW